MPSTRWRSGRKRSSEAREVGLAEAAGRPRAQVADRRLEVVGLVREARGERLDRGGHVLHEGAGPVAVGVRARARRRRCWSRRSASVASRRRAHAGPRRRRCGPRPARAAKAWRGGPVDEVAPAAPRGRTRRGSRRRRGRSRRARRRGPRRARRRRAARAPGADAVARGARQDPRALGPGVERRRRGRSSAVARAPAGRRAALGARSARTQCGAWWWCVVVAGRVSLPMRIRSAPSRSFRLVPYFSCSPRRGRAGRRRAATKRSTASSSASVSRGEPPGTTRSQRGSEGWARTRTSAPVEGGVGERALGVRAAPRSRGARSASAASA